MKLSYVTTHWTPEDAHMILSFLDDVRDTILASYGNDIMEHYQQHAQALKHDTGLEDDNIPF